MITVNDLWHSTDPTVWAVALRRYWDHVQPKNLAVEQELDKLDLKRLRKFDARGWYDFLHNKYFKWKYTDSLKYAMNVRHIRELSNDASGLATLLDIRNCLLDFNTSDILCGLKIATRIKGLGTAGASGLLAVMYPQRFGTVDRFVVEALQGVEGLPEAEAINCMDPEKSLTPPRGELLIRIMRRKAAKLNELFETDEWTPRKIDMVLWGTRTC